MEKEPTILRHSLFNGVQGHAGINGIAFMMLSTRPIVAVL